MQRAGHRSWFAWRPEGLGRLTLAEVSGSLGDLGTLVPLLVGMAHTGSIDFVPALFFAGLFNVGTGLAWGVPMCVQPMKTIAAVALTDGLTRIQVSLAGIFVSAIVFLLGATRGIIVVNNLVPLAVIRGMQLGLGLSLMRRGFTFVVDDQGPLGVEGSIALGGACFAGTMVLQRWPRVPTALLLFLLGLAFAATHVALSDEPFDARPTLPFSLLPFHNISTHDVSHALLAAALPQLPLTTLNSVVSVYVSPSARQYASQ